MVNNMKTELKKSQQLELINKLKLSNDILYIYNTIKPIFELEYNGMPKIVDGEILYKAWKLIESKSAELEDMLMTKRFYNNSNERYDEFLKTSMKKVEKSEFFMGSDKNSKLKYCGEEPQHKVLLSTFYVSENVITEDLYRKYNPTYNVIAGKKNMPAVNISWYDSVMFSKWIDCRLLTEAEWEYSCRANSVELWCCNEKELYNYAWYSENSMGQIKEIAQLSPNGFGLYDMHGNVWEWVSDSYDEHYYENSSTNNPVNNSKSNLKVCRGGSVQAFSEMCRTAFRNYEPANFSASDIGFRVAKN